MKNNQIFLEQLDPIERFHTAMEICKRVIFHSEGIDPNISDEYEFTYKSKTKVVTEMEWWEDTERTIGHKIQVRDDLREKLGMLIHNNDPRKHPNY